tara:strand:- start:584 stop:1432 length:849 start_codon:yes stop_codon:yes gene_type:complete
MNIGIVLPLPAYYINPALIAETAENLGFDSLWVGEHPFIPLNSQSIFPGSPSGEIPESYSHFVDPFIALSMAASVTKRIKLATGICLITERNPLLLAKEVSTLDQFSKGRFIFGIGTGWLREEAELMGCDFDHRWTQAKEEIDILKKLWSSPQASHSGTYYAFPEVISYPKPFQRPHPPIMIGGTAPNALKRVAKWADGWLPNRVTPEDLKIKRKKLNTLTEQLGRDPTKLSITIHGQPADKDLIASYEKAGADRVTIRPRAVKTDKEMRTELENLARLTLN